MATSRSTMGAGARPIHPSITALLVSGVVAEAEINAAAEYLAKAMQRIHGREWSINISHNAQFVSVSRDFNRGPIRPKPEIA